jgi:hypothetical protein
MSTIETHAQNMWSDHHHSELPMFKLSLDNVLHILGFLSTSDVMLHVSFVNRLFRLATLHGRCWSTFSLSSNKSLVRSLCPQLLVLVRVLTFFLHTERRCNFSRFADAALPRCPSSGSVSQFDH